MKKTKNRIIEFFIDFCIAFGKVFMILDSLFVSVVLLLPKRVILFYFVLSCFASVEFFRYCLLCLNLMVFGYVCVAGIQRLSAKIQYGGKNGNNE